MSEIVRDYASEKGSSFYLTFNFYFPYFLVSLWTILSILLQKLNCWVEVYLRSLNTTEKLTGRTNLDVFQRRCLALSEEFLWSAKNENQLKTQTSMHVYAVYGNAILVKSLQRINLSEKSIWFSKIFLSLCKLHTSGENSLSRRKFSSSTALRGSWNWKTSMWKLIEIPSDDCNWRFE